jgi:hypothetical protein
MYLDSAEEGAIATANEWKTKLDAEGALKTEEFVQKVASLGRKYNCVARANPNGEGYWVHVQQRNPPNNFKIRIWVYACDVVGNDSIFNAIELMARDGWGADR